MDEELIIENNVKIIKTATTFYNPAQKFNRDLTILCINHFIKDIKLPRIFEAMSATGLRGIRFVKELTLSEIYLNDRDKFSFETIKNNLIINDIKLLSNTPFNIIDIKNDSTKNDSTKNFNNESIKNFNNESTKNFNNESTKNYNNESSKICNNESSKTPTIRIMDFTFDDKSIKLCHSDCNAFLYNNKNLFNVIDIDPFGCCTPFIDSALCNIRNNGMLCLTSTDTSVLCSNRDKCNVKYNSFVKRGNPAHHEIALRVLLGYVEAQAGKYNKTIIPLLSVSIDFYIRVFVKVKEKRVKILNIAHYLYCSCFNMMEYDSSIHQCTTCANKKLHLVGPYYKGTINDITFVKALIEKNECQRIDSILNIINDELDIMGYYSIPDMSRRLKKCCIPITNLMNALFNSGYKVSLTHCELNAIKTTAPINVVYDLITKYFSGEDKKVFEINDANGRNYQRKYKRNNIASKLGPLSLPKTK